MIVIRYKPDAILFDVGSTFYGRAIYIESTGKADEDKQIADLLNERMRAAYGARWNTF